MRSQRYKYVRNCATDCLINKVCAHFYYGYSYYPMKDEYRRVMPVEFYMIKNSWWWDKIDNKKLIYDSQYDKENHVFSNSHLEKWRMGYQYIMRK